MGLRGVVLFFMILLYMGKPHISIVNSNKSKPHILYNIYGVNPLLFCANLAYNIRCQKDSTKPPDRRPLRRRKDNTMKYTYKCFEDNAGCLHLAVLDDSGACVYYLADQDRALIRETLDALRAGGDPIADGWEGGEPDPAACYAWIVDAVNRDEAARDLMHKAAADAGKPFEIWFEAFRADRLRRYFSLMYSADAAKIETIFTENSASKIIDALR